MVVDALGPSASAIGRGLKVDLEAKLVGDALTFSMFVVDKTGLRAWHSMGASGLPLPTPELEVCYDDGRPAFKGRFTFG